MDKASWRAILANVRNAAGFLRAVDWEELSVCAEQHGSESDRHLITIMRDAARRLPHGHL
jgi:hypothetical protein